ncbi:MAG: dockerin type I domain-containing protein [Pirellulaceae bacterium]
MQHFHRPLVLETLESRQLLAGNAFGFQNPLVHQDVNNDDQVTPIDVLLIANRLNGNHGDDHVRHFLDVDGDEDITTTDGQDVIDGLNGAPRETLPVFEHVRHIARKLRKAHPNLPSDLQAMGTQVLDRMGEFETDIQAIREQIRDFLNLPDTDQADLKARMNNIRNTVTQHATNMIDKLDLLKADDIDTAQLETGELDNRAIPIPRRLREAMEIDDLPSDLDAERVVEVMDAMDKRQWRPFRHQGFKHQRPRLTPQTRAQHLARLQAKIDSGTLPEFINTEKAARFLALLQGGEGEASPLTEDFSPLAHDEVFAELETLAADDNIVPTFPN